jgi:hypothetical protein
VVSIQTYLIYPHQPKAKLAQKVHLQAEQDQIWQDRVPHLV